MGPWQWSCRTLNIGCLEFCFLLVSSLEDLSPLWCVAAHIWARIFASSACLPQGHPRVCVAQWMPLMLAVCAQAPGALTFLPVVQTQSPASLGLSFMLASFQLPSGVPRARSSPGSQVFLKTDFRAFTHSFLSRLSLVNFWLVCCWSQQTALSLQNSGFFPLVHNQSPPLINLYCWPRMGRLGAAPGKKKATALAILTWSSGSFLRARTS